MEYLSMRVYLTRGLCDVSDLAAQQRYTDLTIGGIKYSISRSLAYSNALHHGHPLVHIRNENAIDYALAKIGRDNLHVHHKNNMPRHNFSNNLAIVTQSENNRHAQQNARERNQILCAHGFCLIICADGRIYWRKTCEDNAISVVSLDDVATLIRAPNASRHAKYALKFSSLASRTVSSSREAGISPRYRFSIDDITGTQESYWTLGQLHMELKIRGFMVEMWQLKKFVNVSAPHRNSRSLYDGIQITYLSSDGTRMNTMTLRRK